jgi:hypothetical protein
MLEVLPSQPPIERNNILYVVPRVHQVSRMNENVSFGERRYPVLPAMRIGEEDKAHGIVFRLWGDLLRRSEGIICAVVGLAILRLQ